MTKYREMPWLVCLGYEGYTVSSFEDASQIRETFDFSVWTIPRFKVKLKMQDAFRSFPHA